MDEGIIKKKFDEEYKRMAKFQKSFLNIQDVRLFAKEFDAKRYATYVLNIGTLEEKKELLGSVKNKIMLREKKVLLANG